MKFSPLRSIWLSFCLLILILPASVNAEPAAAPLNRFLARYTTPVFNMLTRIHAEGMEDGDRYLILSSKKPIPQHVVQCVFYDNDTKILCEAASGFYNDPGYHLSAKTRNAIRNMGFSMDDRKGNFQREFTVTGPQTLWAVAGFMVETLYRGYGMRLGEMQAYSPFIPQKAECHHHGKCTISTPALEENVAEKVDEALGKKLVLIATGYRTETGFRDGIPSFIIYRRIEEHSTGTGWYWVAVNPWTGDVWDIMTKPDCVHLMNPALAQELEQIKKRFGKEELKEYERLGELTPIRVTNRKSCGSPEGK